MGYFAYAYIVEGAEDDSGISMTRSIYRAHLSQRALFSWDRGDRPPGMKAYADGTLFCSEHLELLPGYPLRQSYRADEGGSPDEMLLEEGFVPEFDEEPVLYHLMLPPHFVPRPDRAPLQQPGTPSVLQDGGRLIISYAVQGGADIRFRIARLRDHDRFENYDLSHILKAPSSRAAKVSFEVNLGVVKLAFGS